MVARREQNPKAREDPGVDSLEGLPRSMAKIAGSMTRR
jgi:hypothetical protein